MAGVRNNTQLRNGNRPEHFDGVLRADKAGGDDTVRNSAFYSILASEWPSVKARLLERLQARAATAE